MGVIQTVKDAGNWVVDKANTVNQAVNPLKQAGDVLAAPPESQEQKDAIGRAQVYPTVGKAIVEGVQNRANQVKGYIAPKLVPRAKGGRVKAGGPPMKNVDNSGLKKEPC